MSGRRQSPTLRISSSETSYHFDAAHAPAAVARSGDIVVFETLDARAGCMFVHEPGSLVELRRPLGGRGNPLTGPLAVSEAEPGDALLVTIEDVVCASPGWVGGHAHAHPASEGRIPRALARVCALREGRVEFSEQISFPLAAMIGTMGTATAGAPMPCGRPGRHGGNLDHPILSPGARVFLPVFVPGALLYVGDVHAAQGDGELSGVAVEVGAEVTLRVDVEPKADLVWPWVETKDRVAVLTTGPSLEEARREAVDAVLHVLERQLGLEPAEALALMSAVGDLRFGQAFGGMEPTLRLELPRSLGLRIGR